MTRRQKKKIKAYIRAYTARFLALCIVLGVMTGGFLLVRTVVRFVTGDKTAMSTVIDDKAKGWFGKKQKRVLEAPEFEVALLPMNGYSRPGEDLPEVNAVFVHYTANPGTTAMQNRNYFANLAVTGETSASSHFIIGYDGEIVQCVPLSEIAYAVKGRNYDSISIECCYLEESGKFTRATYDSLIRLSAWLLGRYELDEKNMLRHYDEGGKNCPKFYVEHEKEWEGLVHDIGQYIEENGVYDEGETNRPYGKED